MEFCKLVSTQELFYSYKFNKNFSSIMSLVTKFFNILGVKEQQKLPYWLKITTKVPKCTYYFGPFDSPLEAKALQAGYIEDLMEEEAQGIHLELEQALQPENLTVCEDDDFDD
ncbi:MAG: DUF1816 domain-containing protein [Waterburya sp.]